MKVSQALLILASIILAVAQSFGVNPAAFQKAVDYGSGAAGANFVVSVDVNGDGFPDVIIATNNGVSVLLNDALGDGVLLSPTTYATAGTLSESVAVVDVNGDGLPDIVVTNMCTQEPPGCYGVAVLLNNSNNPGTFLSAVGYDTGGLETGAVAVGDVNGDGYPDLVVVNDCQQYTCAGGTLSLLLNNGNGTFGKPTDLSDAKGPVAMGDMTGDGCTDLVTAAGVMLNNCDGSGTFKPANNQVVGGALSITLADVNHDGKLDVAVTLPNGVAVQLGNGDGTLQQNPTVLKTGAANPIWIAIADFNGDTNPDLAVINECTQYYKGQCFGVPTVSVLAGKGNGTFWPEVGFSTGAYFGTSVAAADVNQDGKIDLVASNACITADQCGGSGSVAVLLNVFTTATTTKVASSLNPSTLGQGVTFTATVTWQYGTVPNGETVTFYDGSTELGTGTTSSGAAQFTTSSLAAGPHSIKATYAGDAYFLTSTGTVLQVVNPYGTTTTLSSSPNPSNYGQQVGLTAVVTSAGGNVPTGKVSFYNGGALLGIGTLDATGTATLNTAKLAVGVDSLTATYDGDSNDGKSTSPPLMQTVNQAQITMTLSSTPNPSKHGQAVKFTATLSSNGGLPVGQPVTFSYNSTPLGNGNVGPLGIAVFVTNALPQGADVVTASYAGDADYSAASAQTTQNVN